MNRELGVIIALHNLVNSFLTLLAYYNHPRKDYYIKDVAKHCVELTSIDSGATSEDYSSLFFRYSATSQAFTDAYSDWCKEAKKKQASLPTPTAISKKNSMYKLFCEFQTAIIPALVEHKTGEEFVAIIKQLV